MRKCAMPVMGKSRIESHNQISNPKFPTITDKEYLFRFSSGRQTGPTCNENIQPSNLSLGFIFHTCCMIHCKHLRLSDANKRTYLLTYLLSSSIYSSHVNSCRAVCIHTKFIKLIANVIAKCQTAQTAESVHNKVHRSVATRGISVYICGCFVSLTHLYQGWKKT